MRKTQVENIVWVDLLRVVACFLVVVAHSCDPFVSQFDSNYSEFLSGAFWGSLVRPCVPLFVMISGVLLFPVKTDMASFYKRRMSRILIPLVFWSIVPVILYYFYLNYAATTTNPAIDMTGFTLSASLSKLYLFIFNFNYDTIPLWYLYMLIGLYLIMPIISVWLTNATQKEVKLFLKIWGVSMVLPYVQMFAPIVGYAGNYGSMGILGVCEWNAYGTFYYFSGFLGYAVLAYYLVKYPLNWSWKRTLSITIPMFIIGYAVTSFGFILTQKYYPGSYANLEVIWYFSGINVFFMTFAIFVIMQKVNIKHSPFLPKVASLTFGIYLCHFFFTQLSYDLLYESLPLPAFLKIPVMAGFTFLISYGVIWLFSKVRIMRKVIM